MFWSDRVIVKYFLYYTDANLPQEKQADLAQVLKIKDALEKKKNNSGRTILQHVCISAKECTKLGDVLDLIVASGVDVNVKCIHSGDTALHYAAFCGYHEVTKLLLKHGAQVNEANKKGDTALHLAAQNDEKAIVKRLGHSSIDATARYQAFLLGKKKTVEVLLNDKNIDVNAKDKEGQTALHDAVLHVNETIVDKLLNATNINVNAQETNNKTALHIAASCGHHEVVQLLLNKRADKTVQNKEKKTPLEVAQEALRSCKAEYKYRKVNLEACINLLQKS
ncbi:MAG: ankyrin repeat domain-containing protein [Amoebophilaceae bacterium]|nr:ankyrin repeat domain-containing protein [Amoebophilaceae bacterium]